MIEQTIERLPDGTLPPPPPGKVYLGLSHSRVLVDEDWREQADAWFTKEPEIAKKEEELAAYKAQTERLEQSFGPVLLVLAVFLLVAWTFVGLAAL